MGEICKFCRRVLPRCMLLDSIEIPDSSSAALSFPRGPPPAYFAECASAKLCQIATPGTARSLLLMHLLCYY